jgi:N-acetylglucosaminyldiphosphoundecaprenol N-acetyl-beta-D-mannosaminyltransferase
MAAAGPGPSRADAAASLENRFSRSGRLRSKARRALVGALWRVVTTAGAAAKRILDVGSASAILVLSSPVYLAAAAMGAVRRSPVLAREAKAGRWCEEFQELSFAPTLGGLWTLAPIRRLPVICNVLRGEMSFVGPRAVRPGELNPRERSARRRYDVRPGLICLWWVRRRANIAYESEASLDDQYVDSHGALGDIGIALRALPAALYGESSGPISSEVRIAGIRIDNFTMSEAIDSIRTLLAGSASSQICFVNPDCVNIAMRNAGYRQCLSASRLVLADGIGIKLAGKMLGITVKQNVNGTDLFPRLMQALEGTGMRVFLLGARPGIPELVAEWIARNAPGVQLAGVRNGYFKDEEADTVIAQIREARTDLLLVAFGAPRQELWLSRNLAATGAKVAMGVGGLFDFYSGRIPRAPVWMREIGMEWLFRFLQEPRRMWRRYFVGNVVFLWHAWRRRGVAA